MRWLLLVFVAACSKGSAPAPTTGSSAKPTANIAPTMQIDAARVVPTIERACQTTADCAITSDTFDDSPPQTYACCSGCSETAVSATSYKAFQEWCQGNPPPTCPALDCKMIPQRAVCEAGQCVARAASVVQPPAPARVVPEVDTACRTAADCTLTSNTFEDSPPQTYACCSGCSETAVSTTSFKAFQAWCKANPPPQCPPLGCLMPQMRASCEAGHCAAKDASHVTLPKAP